MEIIYARGFQRRCPARGVMPEGLRRCDLRPSHSGPHRADYGMYEVVWREQSWTEQPHATPKG
jgi:hypothetical protein